MFELEQLVRDCISISPTHAGDYACWMISTGDVEGYDVNDYLPLDRCVMVAPAEASRLSNSAVTSFGALHVGWFNSYAAIVRDGKPEPVENRDGYTTSVSWKHSDVTDNANWHLLPQEELEDNKEILRALVKPAGRALFASLDPRKRERFVVITMPPLAGSSYPLDPAEYLSRCDWARGQILVCDVGQVLIKESLLRSALPESKKRHYLLYVEKECDSGEVFAAVTAYDVVPEHDDIRIERLGGLISGNGRNQPVLSTCHERKVVAIGQGEDEELPPGSPVISGYWKPAKPIWSNPHDTKMQLEKLSSTFIDEPWSLVKQDVDISYDTSVVGAAGEILSQYSSLGVNEIICRSHDLWKGSPSLSDALLMYHTLMNSPLFEQPGMLRYSQRDYCCGQFDIPVQFTKQDVSNAPSKLIYYRCKLLKDPAKTHRSSRGQWQEIDELLLRALTQLEEPTIQALAEELLFHKGIKPPPTAYFATALFLYISSRQEEYMLFWQ